MPFIIRHSRVSAWRGFLVIEYFYLARRISTGWIFQETANANIPVAMENFRFIRPDLNSKSIIHYAQWSS